MAFSKLPRILITEEDMKILTPGPGDYNPKNHDRVKGLIISKETEKKTVVQSSKPNYLQPKDISKVKSRLNRSSRYLRKIFIFENYFNKKLI